MTFDWQDGVALLVVAVALGSIVRSALRVLGPLAGPGDAGCGAGCGSCPSRSSPGTGPRPTALVSITTTPPARPRIDRGA